MSKLWPDGYWPRGYWPSGYWGAAGSRFHPGIVVNAADHDGVVKSPALDREATAAKYDRTVNAPSINTEVKA